MSPPSEAAEVAAGSDLDVEAERLRRAQRAMVAIRWAGVVFGIVQVLTYYQPYPSGYLPIALSVVGALAIGNSAVALMLRSAGSRLPLRRLAVTGLTLDAAVVFGFVVVYTFDPDTAIWALVYILPLEAATFFGLRGALLTTALFTVAYTAREWFGFQKFGNEFLPTSISFRMGIAFIVAGTAGSMASRLLKERDEVQRTADRLRVAIEELREADELKDDFLAMTNHELRTPLTTILGYATFLEHRWDDLPEERKRQSVDWIAHEGRRLLLLVEDLLTLSSAQAGALDVQLTDVDLATVVADAIAENGEAAAAVTVACEPGLRVVADAHRLEQILTNFLSNALKYGEPPVAITARTAGDVVEICVSDQGSGVPEDFVPFLFDKFSQASRGPSRTAGGTGLGLAIVDRLAGAQNGKVWYEPGTPKGSRFCLRLPKAT